MTVSDDVKSRIKGYTDVDLLTKWLKRSFWVSSADELFQESV